MRWEYKTIPSGDPHLTWSEQLNLFGKDGWELVAISEFREGGIKWFIFKRPEMPVESYWTEGGSKQ
jgi:hypothetical protein